MKRYVHLLIILLALGGPAGSAWAQGTVIDDKPADIMANISANNALDKANPVLDDHRRQINAADYNAPRQLFNNPGPSLPLPQPLIINQDPSVQDALNKRRNWMLLTPEQILGIKTPEEILGIKNPDDQKKLSLEEKFLLRQSQAAAGGVTNGSGNGLFSTDNGNPFGENKDARNPFTRGYFTTEDVKNRPGSARSLGQLFNMKPNDSVLGGERKPESPWTSVFAQPSAPKMTPEQLADRERFQALMEPNSPPDKPATPVRYSTTTTPAPSPFLQPQPKFNPAGRSYATLENNTARPTGITPLPGITGPAPKPVEKRPSWQAQPPPWLSEGPPARNPARGF